MRKSTLVSKVSALGLAAVLACLSLPCQAGLVGFQALSWDAGAHHIYRNGAPIAEPAAEVLPDFADADYYFVQEVYENSAIAHSGSASNNPNIYQHVYTYTLPEMEIQYAVNNTTGHTRTFSLSAEDLGLGSKKRKVKLVSDVILDGSLLLYKNPDNPDSNKNLEAMMEVVVTREDGKKIFDGAIALSINKNGVIKINTSGKITKQYIDLITEDDNSLRVDFFEAEIPFKTRVKLGQEFSLITEVKSSAVNMGDGTGAEVIFGPGSPTLPTLKETNNVPEPATMLLLTIGGLMASRCRRRNRG
ncbi:MAG: PEP-CTERM sorting domain-containing protein [Sedimentisphaerales bacterium]|nr:PEP-CTERM sorting domain-containing protein [Sedimentisphaerales bacterium]